jgi:outer membrane beta-barrel protein
MRALVTLLFLAPALALAQAPASTSASTSKPASGSGSAPSAASEQEAGDVSEVDRDALGPLRERIRPVSGHLFLKRGRFEFSPSATVSVRDAFFTKYILGGTLTWYPVETLGISLRAGYSIPTVAGSAQICTFTETDRSCRAPRYSELDGRAPGQITLLGGLDVQWAPIYGKLSLLAEQFLHFDLYATGGVAAVQYRGPALQGTGGSPMLTAGGNVGAGMRIFLNPAMTVRAEFRNLTYVEQGTQSQTYLRNQLLFELGVSFFLPTALPEP